MGVWGAGKGYKVKKMKKLKLAGSGPPADKPAPCGQPAIIGFCQ
jgi:hypothetical protein